LQVGTRCGEGFENIGQHAGAVVDLFTPQHGFFHGDRHSLISSLIDAELTYPPAMKQQKLGVPHPPLLSSRLSATHAAAGALYRRVLAGVR
jgi:hypothetical protein